MKTQFSNSQLKANCSHLITADWKLQLTTTCWEQQTRRKSSKIIQEGSAVLIEGVTEFSESKSDLIPGETGEI